MNTTSPVSWGARKRHAATASLRRRLRTDAAPSPAPGRDWDREVLRSAIRKSR